MTTTDPLGGSVAPRYGSSSIVDVLPAALSVLTGAPAPDPLGLVDRLSGVRRLVVLLVDGFGYHLIPAAARVGATIADVHAGKLGELLRLTTGFPSTTPTSLVGLGTGVVPGAHGILGFHVRVPGTDRVLNHIRWSDDPDPARWQPVPTVFTLAAAAGVATTVIADGEYEGSGLTVSAYRGSAYRPGAEIDELVAGVRAALHATPRGPALVYAYHPDLDKVGHGFGVASPEWRVTAAEVDRLLGMLVDSLPPDAALLVTADHGQLDVPADHRFDLAGDSRLREGITVLAGEPRVRYLHTLPGAAADVAATWSAVLGDAAWVATREEVVDAGLYGPVAPEHLDRIGDLVVICRRDYVVIDSGYSPFESMLVGYHGAATPAEMEIPLMVVRGSA